MEFKSKLSKGFTQYHLHITIVKLFGIFKLKNKQKSKSRLFSESSAGLTLLELIVVLAVFLVIVGATFSIFISIIGHQKRILTGQEFLNQASYTIEYMSRSIRMAARDSFGDCLNGQPGLYLLTHPNVTSGFYEGIKFVTYNNVCQEFFLDSDGIFKEIKDNGLAQSLMSSKFKINYARIIANGDKNLQRLLQGDLVQPRITISFDIQVQSSGGQQEKILQTTVSQRNLNTN